MRAALVLVFLFPVTARSEPARHRAPPAPSGPRTHRAPPASSSSSSGKRAKNKGKRRKRRGSGGVAAAILGGIGAAMVGGALRALLGAKGPGPRTRHTFFLELGGGYGGLWLPDRLEVERGGVVLTKLGFRTRPLGHGDGMALEAAFVVGGRGLLSGPAEEGGYGLTRVGGELRLHGRARHRAQPYLLGGCGYYTLEQEGEQGGVGLQAGGGLQLWLARNLALDLSAVYDVAFFPRQPELQGLSGTSSFKIYF